MNRSNCRAKAIAQRFLAMGRTDMELVYLMIKDHPGVEEAYQLAKQAHELKDKENARAAKVGNRKPRG